MVFSQFNHLHVQSGNIRLDGPDIYFGLMNKNHVIINFRHFRVNTEIVINILKNAPANNTSDMKGN